ncbi:MAG TPA: helix-turn-helix domain-containing protein [Gemmatimonadota bacterium]|nr:helix-turn-helix domain-containing protein [Gemmatimonadota bacterium]
MDRGRGSGGNRLSAGAGRPFQVAVYGPATDYSDLIPSAPEFECIFLGPDAVPRSARPTSPPDLVLLDLDFLGRRAGDLLVILGNLSPAPAVLAVSRSVTADSDAPPPVGVPAGTRVLPREPEELRKAIEDRFEEWVRFQDREAGSRKRLVIELPPDGLSLADYERQIIRFTLERHGWNRSRAARELRISRPRLQRKIEKYGLGPAGRRG